MCRTALAAEINTNLLFLVNITPVPESNNTTMIATIIICIVLGVIAFGALIYFCLIRRAKLAGKRGGDNLEKNLLISSTTDNNGDKSSFLGNNGTGNVSTTTDVTFIRADHLTLTDIISRGRYSVVRKARIEKVDENRDEEREEFAVKIYENSNKNYFLNEKNLFSLTLLNHENIVKFHGAHERSIVDVENTESTMPDFWLIMEYMPCGTLQDYLKSNTFDFHSMCKIALSVAKGLAFLHLEFRKNGKSRNTGWST